MPIILEKQTVKQRDMLRDVRPVTQRLSESVSKNDFIAAIAAGFIAVLFVGSVQMRAFADFYAVLAFFYFRWTLLRPFALPFKIPAYANIPDPHNPLPGKKSAGKSEGILYLGNVFDADDPENGRELWLTNNDARTHILYLGTTGSGKTVGLTSMVTNALAWGSGYAYTDGKADTDLWASLYSLARRFGRDDDVLVLNYMTGNSDDGSTSNSMNPFSNGSASYLANLVVNLMPDAGGDNAMWKERAVALLFALLPALTYKRDKQGLLLDVGVVRDYLELKQIIQLSRDQTLSERVTRGLISYLNTLPGYVDAAFDDEGNERPPSPDQPMYDLQVARQQHGYLAMQFTRSMQSLADEYGYIFKVQLADIDVLDVVLNRRILIVLIPALEKSDNEAANLGKIVASCLKGMMGATLGNTVEGGWEDAIGSKQTRASSSFMTVFDEVGYYTAAGMAVMAAQARSLGFSLVFATQDLPSMEKRIKQEAKSIVGNCNLKIFGRIEDPTDTRDFVSKHSGTRWVMESSGFSASTNTISSMFMTLPFQDNRNTSYQSRARVDYDHLRGQREGEAHLMFADWAHRSQMFYAVAEKAKALRVHRFLPVPILTKSTEMRDRAILELTARLKDADWTAMNEGGSVKTSPEIAALSDAVQTAAKAGLSALEMGVFAVASISKLGETAAKEASSGDTAPKESSKDKKAPAITNTRGGQPLTTPVSALAEDTELAQTPREKFSDMPAVTENDVFSIEELERAPVYTAPQTIASFAGTNADLSAVVPSTRLTQDSTDFAALTLPDSVKSALAESAQRMSKGLSGKAGQV